jgi:hypothetical protein
MRKLRTNHKRREGGRENDEYLHLTQCETILYIIGIHKIIQKPKFKIKLQIIGKNSQCFKM